LEPGDSREYPTSLLLPYTQTSLLPFKFVVHLLNKVFESHLSAKTPPVDLACLPVWESSQTQSKYDSCKRAACEQSGRKV
jgi:hypothetical protein